MGISYSVSLSLLLLDLRIHHNNGHDGDRWRRRALPAGQDGADARPAVGRRRHRVSCCICISFQSARRRGDLSEDAGVNRWCPQFRPDELGGLPRASSASDLYKKTDD